MISLFRLPGITIDLNNIASVKGNISSFYQRGETIHFIKPSIESFLLFILFYGIENNKNMWMCFSTDLWTSDGGGVSCIYDFRTNSFFLPDYARHTIWTLVIAIASIRRYILLTERICRNTLSAKFKDNDKDDVDVIRPIQLDSKRFMKNERNNDTIIRQSATNR